MDDGYHRLVRTDLYYYQDAICDLLLPGKNKKDEQEGEEEEKKNKSRQVEAIECLTSRLKQPSISLHNSLQTLSVCVISVSGNEVMW